MQREGETFDRAMVRTPRVLAGDDIDFKNFMAWVCRQFSVASPQGQADSFGCTDQVRVRWFPWWYMVVPSNQNTTGFLTLKPSNPTPTFKERCKELNAIKTQDMNDFAREEEFLQIEEAFLREFGGVQEAILQPTSST
jgi:hypothetical protein